MSTVTPAKGYQVFSVCLAAILPMLRQQINSALIKLILLRCTPTRHEDAHEFFHSSSLEGQKQVTRREMYEE
ncbi:hypothetical protein KIN20_034278 [Parelaphostrongylus tenuis]|uniref:Uncharacterized protein n=1 Tax=Parelaphostrongylus tenuis TaxID=148309 RepID=A0AAD5WJX5_PARTN|nr:hypothetical protein KIN20_034278 [Parelaphostrongylus tenuis]